MFLRLSTDCPPKLAPLPRPCPCSELSRQAGLAGRLGWMSLSHAPLEAVHQWVLHHYGDRASVRVVRRREILGGQTSAMAIALDVVVTDELSGEKNHDLFWKIATPQEACALRAVEEEGHALGASGCVLPELLAHGAVDGHPWVLLPFYSGQVLGQRANAPLELAEGLAALHSHFLNNPGAAVGLPQVNADHWRKQCSAAAESALAGDGKGCASGERIARLFNESTQKNSVDRALAILPFTLVHGDVHEGNILLANSYCRLIDWGNAKLGPGMLDIANMAAPGSALFNHYVRTLADFQGSAPDTWLTLVGYEWSQVQICTQYLPYTVRANGLQAALNLATYMQKSLDELSKLLDEPNADLC
jgi:hypothetical protein